MPEKKVVKIIQELSGLLKEQFEDFRGLYLYGSQAVGTARRGSDIDILGVFDTTFWEKTYEISGIICYLDYKYNVFIDFRAYTPSQLERNPVYYDEVVNKGIYYAT